MSIGDEIQLVTFSVGGQEFGFNVFDVERVLRYEEPTPLPESAISACCPFPANPSV